MGGGRVGVEFDVPARVARATPLGHRCGCLEIERALPHPDADQGADHALGHRPAGERRLRVETFGVALGDDPSPVDDDDGAGLAPSRVGRLREDLIQRSVELRRIR